MGNPLLMFWHRIFAAPLDQPAEPDATDRPDRSAGHGHGGWHGTAHGFGRNAADGPAAAASGLAPSTGAIFLVLRRMRVPLIVLILVFAISVLGLTLIPGAQPDGGTEPMSFFDAFYFMSYTATTIGFGEIPYPLTTPQRLWVTFSIYMAVIGWAYAIGTLLALTQDRGFRRALETQQFSRRTRRLPERFLIVVGYGEAGTLVVRALDAKGWRLVVVDRSQERIDALALAAVRADVPALCANTRAPETLRLAGLERPGCAGVLALTDDDDANLAVVQSVHLLRPGLPVIARAEAVAMAARMAAFGQPTVVNPFDAFGDRLRTTLRTPTLSQLVDWLVMPVGDPLPPRPAPPGDGAWLVVGPHRTVGEVGTDLREAGLPVTELDPGRDKSAPEERVASLAADAVGLVAAADRDTVNISCVDAARRANPGIFVVARQESPANAALFAALAPDLLLVPAEVVAREVLERLANPELLRFLGAARGQGEAWAADLLARLVQRCGPTSPTVWQVSIDPVGAPTLHGRLGQQEVTLGALMPSPFGRSEQLPVVALMLTRGDERVLAPPDETPLAAGDILLLAGGRGAQRAWDAILHEEEALAYVLSGQAVATSWWGRRLLGSSR